MPGLKALTDRIEGPRRSRCQSFYTASYSLGSAVSLFVTGLLAQRYGWAVAFAAVGIAPLLAILVLLWRVPPARPAARQQPQALLDFGPVLVQIGSRGATFSPTRRTAGSCSRSVPGSWPSCPSPRSLTPAGSERP